MKSLPCHYRHTPSLAVLTRDGRVWVWDGARFEAVARNALYLLPGCDEWGRPGFVAMLAGCRVTDWDGQAVQPLDSVPESAAAGSSRRASLTAFTADGRVWLFSFRQLGTTPASAAGQDLSGNSCS